jgi:site-specific recombinase XerD
MIEIDLIWLSALRAAGRRPATLAIYDYALGQLKAWRGDDDLAAVSRFEALAFARHLNETYKPSGVDSRLKALKAFYNWGLVEELVSENPFRRITVTIPNDPRPTASEDEIEAMLARGATSRC